jgi:hypothetical protein
MAKVISKVAFDMRSTGDMSVHDLLKGRDAKFDNHFIRLEYRKSHERDTFKGSFSADPGRKTISGSAKSWTHSKDGRLQWEIANASISASAVLKAAQTNKTKDDLAVIEKTFAGNDQITGSKFADKLFGYNGNDTIDGGLGGGIDKIDGGSGHDRVSYADSSKAFVVTLTGATISTVLANGVSDDRIINIEDVAGGKAADIITDFKHKQDKIDLSAIDAISSTVGIDDAFTWDGKGTVKTKHAEGHFGYYQVNAKGTANDHTYIVVNNDSDKAPEMTIELQGLVKLGPIDFIL